MAKTRLAAAVFLMLPAMWARPVPGRVAAARGLDEGAVAQVEKTPAPVSAAARAGGDPRLIPPPADQPQPRFACAEPIFDLGDIWVGNGCKPAWTIENTGDAPLFVRLRSDCCTDVRPSELRLLPGSRAQVGAVVQCARTARTVTALTNDREHPQVTLETRGTHCSALRRERGPNESDGVDFRDVPRTSGPRTQSVVFARHDGGPMRLRVQSIEPDVWYDDGLAPVEAVVREIEPGDRYALDVTIGPPWPQRTLKRRVRLETGVSAEPTVDVPIDAQFDWRLLCLTGQTPCVRDEVCEWVGELIWSKEQPPGRVLELTPGIDGVTAWLEEDGGRMFVIARVPPDAIPLWYSRVTPTVPIVHIRTDDAAVPRIEMVVRFERG